MAKAKIKYNIVSGTLPGTQTPCLRPNITERVKMDTDMFVEYALNAGYVRGQFQEVKGQFNGFMEAIKNASLSGYDVSLANWLRVYAVLTGQVDAETRTLTAANSLMVRVQTLTELKAKIDDFTFENVDTAENVAKIYNINGVGDLPNIWTKGKDLVVTGKFMTFDATKGDSCTATYDGLETPISYSTNETDYAHTKFAWNAALAELEAGEPIEVKLTLHPDGADKPAQVFTRTLILKNA